MRSLNGWRVLTVARQTRRPSGARRSVPARGRRRPAKHHGSGCHALDLTGRRRHFTHFPLQIALRHGWHVSVVRHCAESNNRNFVATLASQYEGRLRRSLTTRLRNAADVPDLAQEVFLRLLRVDNPVSIRSPGSVSLHGGEPRHSPAHVCGKPPRRRSVDIDALFNDAECSRPAIRSGRFISSSRSKCCNGSCNVSLPRLAATLAAGACGRPHAGGNRRTARRLRGKRQEVSGEGARMLPPARVRGRVRKPADSHPPGNTPNSHIVSEASDLVRELSLRRCGCGRPPALQRGAQALSRAQIQAYLDIAGTWASLPSADPAGCIDIDELVARARAPGADVVSLKARAEAA